MPKNVTILGSLEFMGGIPLQEDVQSKTPAMQKGDHHAREVLRLNDNGRHCRGSDLHFGVQHSDIGSGSGSPGCSASPNAENAMG
jgi:hypothetical protein